MSKSKLAGAAAALSSLVGVSSAAQLVGRPARAVDVVALFAGGFGAGAAVVVAGGARRRDREAVVTDSVTRLGGGAGAAAGRAPRP